jgi:predicted TIM-barrel fold metal-dependent hydrolase
MNSEVIDIHVHFGAPRDEDSGCYWSEEFTKTAAYFAMLLLTESLFKKVDIHGVREHLLGVINGSRFVNKCVLLAMDQVYDENGKAHPEKTHLFVPNRYVAKLASENPRVLFGASVYPFRNDWTEELDYCLENKAVLCKWIPSSQVINPTHQRLSPFYKKLADHSLPLLCHAGPEYAIPTSLELYNELNNPDFLRAPLDQGVIVIVAHCAMPYFGPLDEPIYAQYFEYFLNLVDQADARGWHFYADLSAICIPSRAAYIPRVLGRVPRRMLLYGSDYPVPLTELCYHRGKNFLDRLMFLMKSALTENPLDRNYHLIKEMGFGDAVLANASRLFAKVKYPS